MLNKTGDHDETQIAFAASIVIANLLLAAVAAALLMLGNIAIEALEGLGTLMSNLR